MSASEKYRTSAFSFVISALVLMSLALPVVLVGYAAPRAVVVFAAGDITPTVSHIAPIPTPKPTDYRRAVARASIS
ncbi:hypothetical protein DLJ53_11055 [Acuticoccus sediminis]|uniref:Uncharacterized protein n=1 Tax=Acuticoccus sediminis TaxID=2184697 RepID=A0A8B2NSM3_9HYPH|nr:hypothetical protein [Acuticoccus sediminis]RAI01921.1 hypothetical protein DLJ53_11055 [Acuticoccus sediminis]